MRLGKFLKDREFNLREKFNLYAGPVPGFLIPLAIARYGLGIQSNGIIDEALAWGESAIRTAPFTLVATLGTTTLGGLEANRLRRKRLERELIKGETQ